MRRSARSGGTSRLARAVVVLGLVWFVAGVPTSSPAQFDEGPFAGFALEAWGASFSMIYDDPNGPIPAHPTGEMHAAYGLATLDDGSGHGVASEAWPGPTAATAGPFIEDSFWDGVEEGSDGQFPPPQVGRPALTPRQWPVAAEVFEPAGPHTQDVPPNAHAHSTGELVYSKAATVPLSVPGIFRADGGSTTAEATVGKVKDAAGVEIDAARARVVTTVEDVSILAAVLDVEVDKVTTTAMVTSDGTKPVIAGQTVVSGLTINGEGYTIDENGIHAGGETHPNPITGQLNQAAEQALKDSGISMTLASPIDTTKGPQGSRSVGGLVVRMKSSRLDEVVSQLPDPIEKELRARVSTTHDLTLVFGAANVKASALKALAFEFEEFEFALSDDDNGFDADVLGSSLDSGSFDGGSFDAGSGGTGARQVGPTVVGGRPAFAAPVEVDGVSAAAAIFGLSFVIGVARVLKRTSDRLLAVGTATNCPLGDDE